MANVNENLCRTEQSTDGHTRVEDKTRLRTRRQEGQSRSMHWTHAWTSPSVKTWADMQLTTERGGRGNQRYF